MTTTTTAYAMEKIGDFEVWIKPYRVAGDWDEWDIRLINTSKIIGKVIRRAGGGYMASLQWSNKVWNVSGKTWVETKGVATGKGDTIEAALRAAKVATDAAMKA